jgi:hypothetical protein
MKKRKENSEYLSKGLKFLNVKRKVIFLLIAKWKGEEEEDNHHIYLQIKGGRDLKKKLSVTAKCQKKNHASFSY